MSSKPIGIFDSGVGGLTVMAAIRRLLPQESLVYLGDTARVPYGIKSADTILRYTEECCTFLAKRDVKAIVVACNTASAHAFPYLTHKFHIPLMGVIQPGVKHALEISRNKHIGVIGTQATISSDIYAKELKKLDKNTVVTSLACPLFVPLVEEDWLENEVTEAVAKRYLTTFRQDGVDTLILGCTHYPLLKPVIRQVVGEKIELVDSAEAVANALKDLLTKQSLLKTDDEEVVTQLYVTDLPGRFENIAKRFLGESVPTVKRVTL
ncbi:MAG: glutamate racemase [Deltaproteobacteria bacterium RIFCSPLOWO2_01_44_7]|nr:MAG: glutamate racemase [Deltaproteobacteria bacterium RIFCSPHIGHO2_01_FULL_43_49]OGQ14756.1 MAG: glutamate racemase [Deltaproteobacteria bacterium RIFCSPHIGHO2_02_FULL_44_53]OGQ28142.1 MAG: glutamate racemase [Deltaproteobacteria bacterium RIFCSPHIGHO2_12_FULL_44_21]OGQ31354.1 MAG: glutamate racemase [Deltaproteobacteria bacterium RIFCSPLOWO2_01_FULL_45_74]OGQ43346.1 MAG: glutamate racemase [Deltaproteobacteria bacterium RIFCSPLOWO2_02_FULL_44_34]OGQ44261.1 MAG: glutamate racemase [Deltapr